MPSKSFASDGNARTASAPERAREASMVLGAVLDMSLLFPYFAVAIWAGSLTMMGEVLRGTLLLCLELVLLNVLRRIHRGRMLQYDFGTAKLEQFANLVVGLAMLLAAAWMVAQMLGRMQMPAHQDATGLQVAAAAGLLNLALNAWALRSLWLAGKDGTSIIINGQIRARMSKVIASFLVALAIMVNAVIASPEAALAADLAGSALVAAVMVLLAGTLCRQALPDLLDRTIDENSHAAINRVLAQHFDRYDGLSHVRARLLGKEAQVEIGLIFAGTTSLGVAQSVTDSVAVAVADLIPGARVTVVPSASR